VLSGRVAPKAIQAVKELPNLYVLPVGTTPPNPLELLERNTLGLLMRELKKRFDRIIIDTPAASFGTDGAVIASKCGAGLIVARNNTSRLHALQELVSTVKMGPTQLVGTVLNEH
jgi:Mrp family chromosome partitioning ATPase